MDKKWIEGTISNEHMNERAAQRSPIFSPDRPPFEELAATIIAQAHEQELDDAQMALNATWQNIQADDHATIAQLRGQVVVMRRLLGRSHGTISLYAEGLQMRNPDHTPKLLEDLDAALQDGPEEE